MLDVGSQNMVVMPLKDPLDVGHRAGLKHHPQPGQSHGRHRSHANKFANMQTRPHVHAFNRVVSAYNQRN